MRELNQCKKRMESGTGTDEVLGASKWIFFSAMKFMYKSFVSQSGSIDMLVRKNNLITFILGVDLVFSFIIRQLLFLYKLILPRNLAFVEKIFLEFFANRFRITSSIHST